MIKILQIIDSLHIGGAERVAVNYANGLVNLVDESHLCVSREEGPLLNSVSNEVKYICLNKKSTIDLKAVLKLKTYIVKHSITILHAHSSSFFIAVLVKLLLPKIKIVWHDHYGNSEFLDKRPKLVLRFASRFFSYIFSVNSRLKDWSVSNLKCKNVSYVKNFPVLNTFNTEKTVLKGEVGKRILCLANLREQKNHLRLLEAFKIIKEKHPDWTLHCVGKNFKDTYSDVFFTQLKSLDLEQHVYFYNSRSDILNIMSQSNIGILVSKSEGLPLAMLEYGIANLPVICTNVGNCGLLIPDKSYGILLESDDKFIIANAIISYIDSPVLMQSNANKYNSKIVEEYSSHAILNTIVVRYKQILEKAF